MSCESGQCNYKKALGLAQEIVDANPDGLFQQRVAVQKAAELAVIEVIFEKASIECNGPKDEGICGVAGIVNDTRNFIFSSPMIEVSAKVAGAVGFSTRQD